MIRARALRRTFVDGAGGDVAVLDGVDLDVARGEFVAIVGRSGSGKSTLLNAIGGLDTAYSGQVEVGGAKLSSLTERQLARFRNQTIGFVFQSFHLLPRLRVIDNVRMSQWFAATHPPAGRAEALLKQVGLEAKGERLPGQLSGGERQRVAIARALFAGAPLLLCDEPTGNLDGETADEIIALLQRLNAEGLTVLAVTHEARLQRAAARVLRLDHGRLA